MINYEEEYQNSRNVCGEPFLEIVEFVENYDDECAIVLDSGRGQGRDALFIARKGHSVLGVDSAQTGIEQMLEEAESENLAVDGVIADITNYEAPDLYNIVVIDRALHMLQNDEIRNVVLEKSSNAISKAGFILIVDTPRHKSLICDYFKSVPKIWKIIKNEKNFFFN